MNTIHTGGKCLYIPLEIVVREHDGKTLLAYEAASMGWTVVMGPKLALYTVCDQLPEGIFLVKSIVPSELVQIKALKDAGHKVCSLDEEGVVTYKEFLGSNVRYSHETISEIERIFFWGEAQQEVFNTTFPDFSEKGRVTGNPRYEFWKHYAAVVYSEEAKKIREKYGKYVLLPSSFGIANNILGRRHGIELTKSQYGGASEEMGAFLEGQAEQNLIAFKEYLDFLPDIVHHRQDINFVIRPHPSENHAPWQKLADRFENVHLAYEGSVTPWILGSAAIFHFKSTTSIEAHLMGRPVLTYLPSFPSYMDKYELEVPKALSIVAYTRTELLKALDKTLNGACKYPEGPEKSVVQKWISVIPEQPSAQRILKEIQIYLPSPSRTLKTPELTSKQKLKQQVEHLIYNAAHIPFLNTLIAAWLKERIKSMAYGKRKYMGLDVNHTKQVIEAIERERPKKNSKVRVSNFTDKLFIIQKRKKND